MQSPSTGQTRRIASTAIVCLVFFIDSATLVMANIALPTIKDSLGYDDGSAQWVLTAFALTFGGFLLACGRFCDVLGPKRVLLIGMTVFNASSLVCALVHDKIGFVVGRAFQGLGAAAAIPSAQSILSSTYEDPHQRNIAFAAWGASGSLGFVLGPIIGGLLTSLVSWEWIFWFLLIVEGVLEALGLVVLREIPPAPIGGIGDDDAGSGVSWSQVPSRIDLLGSCLSVSGLVLLVYALTAANEVGWGRTDVVTTLVLSVLLLSVFFFFEITTAAFPLLPHYLWRDITKLAGCALATLTYAVWMGVNYLLTVELQEFGYSALGTALRFIPLGIVALVVNLVVPRLLKPVGARPLLMGSWVLALAGIPLLAVMSSAGDYWRLCLPGMILYTAGIATVYYIGNVMVVATAVPEDQGTISGVYNMFLNVGGAVFGVALTTLIVDSVASKDITPANGQSRLDGFRAGYYYALGLSLLAVVPSIFVVTAAPQLGEEEKQTTDSEENQTDNVTKAG